jgi:hypothetical protein
MTIFDFPQSLTTSYQYEQCVRRISVINLHCISTSCKTISWFKLLNWTDSAFFFFEWIRISFCIRYVLSWVISSFYWLLMIWMSFDWSKSVFTPLVFTLYALGPIESYFYGFCFSIKFCHSCAAELFEFSEVRQCVYIFSPVFV